MSIKRSWLVWAYLGGAVVGFVVGVGATEWRVSRLQARLRYCVVGWTRSIEQAEAFRKEFDEVRYPSDWRKVNAVKARLGE